MNETIPNAPEGYPLSGVVIRGLSQVYNSAYLTFPMALSGALRLKIGPHTDGHQCSRRDISGGDLPFAMLKTHKQPTILDLKAEKGKDLFRQMMARTDSLRENLRPSSWNGLALGRRHCRT